MFKYFRGSFLVAVLGLICAFFWAEHEFAGTGGKALFIVAFLSILEITLSFDNAVINALKLEKMDEKWRHRFITWGIAIAVFGMRFLFPIIVVSVFSGLSIYAVTHLALHDVEQYTHYLHIAHAPLVTFGGAFLMMIFWAYIFNPEKEVHWLTAIEKPMVKVHCIKYIDVIIVLLSLVTLMHFIPEEQKVSVMMAGITGIISYLIVDSISNLLEHIAEEKAKLVGETAKLGFIGFLYLELIDASFSLDGVLGAFALSKDVIIITLGLAIGAMFVRSFTIMLVEKKTLHNYVFLEHGAHWAIGVLAVLMFVSTIHEIPEVVTGLAGLILIVWAFISSVLYNKKHKEAEQSKISI